MALNLWTIMAREPCLLKLLHSCVVLPPGCSVVFWGQPSSLHPGLGKPMVLFSTNREGIAGIVPALPAALASLVSCSSTGEPTKEILKQWARSKRSGSQAIELLLLVLMVLCRAGCVLFMIIPRSHLGPWLGTRAQSDSTKKEAGSWLHRLGHLLMPSLYPQTPMAT